MQAIIMFLEQVLAFVRFMFAGKMPAQPAPKGGDSPQTDYVPVPEQMPSFAESLLRHMEERGYEVNREMDAANIVYVSGVSENFTKNADERDGWNDLRAILSFTRKGMPYILFSATASTAPGEISRKSKAAEKLGGVATVVPGQYRAWKMGFHKGKKNHPALVQCAPVNIWRDSDVDGKSEGEKIYKGVFGINQHSTAPGFSGKKVGAHSAGCLVGKDWEAHIAFIEVLKSTSAYMKDPEHVFLTTVISGSDLRDWE